MTDRPIIFSAPMVRALLDGRKAQHRDVLNDEWKVPCRRGDRLWVREAWKPGAWREDGRVAIDYRASPEIVQTPWIYLPENADFESILVAWTEEVRRAGSVPDEDGFHNWKPGQSPMRWRSPIYMPRWASRLTLTVTDVLVRRVQEISAADAWSEGCPVTVDADHPRYALQWFRDLWNSLHGPDAWDANPWVCVIHFRTEQKNIAAPGE